MTIQYEFPSLGPAQAQKKLPMPLPVPAETLSRAETADCTCPEFCERDHDQD
jgi:hypothetical protein